MTVEPFRAIGLSRLAHQLKSEGRSIIHMEFGQPSTGVPAAALARAHQVLDQDAMGYWESAPLRERICRLYQDRYGVQVDPDRILLTCGASPALVLALSTLFKPGDRIALARPGYVAYRNTLRALHLEPVEIGCGPGAGAELICSRLETGKLFAIDRSESGVDRTKRRCQKYVDAGRLTVRQIDLATLRVPVKRLNKVFAFNVNLFWVRECADEVALLDGGLDALG